MTRSPGLGRRKPPSPWDDTHAVREALFSPDRLEEQYRALSQRLGTEMFLREDLVNYFGYVFLQTYRDLDKALLYFGLMQCTVFTRPSGGSVRARSTGSVGP